MVNTNYHKLVKSSYSDSIPYWQA